MDKKDVLTMLSQGTISVEEATKLMEAYEESAKEEPIKEQKQESNETKTDWSSIISLAPFASSATLAKLVEKALENSANINMGVITALAPFLDDAELKKLVEKLAQDDVPNMSVILSLAPFLDSETLFELICKQKNKFDIKTVCNFAPFLEEEQIDEIINRLIQD